MKYEINDIFLGELDMTKKLYERRNPIAQCCHYTKHIEAMTSEGLYCKSDIAAELAHRDIIIEDLSSILSRIAEELGFTEKHTSYATKRDLINKAYTALNQYGLSQHKE